MVIAAVGAVTHGTVRLEAQRTSASELTAAFLFNFVKFTTWPDDVLRDDDPIVVCVSGNGDVADSLARLTRDQRVDEHPLAVQRTNLVESLVRCHVVYGAALDNSRALLLIRTTAGHPILTVSDSADFAQRGGVANFFIDGGRMRFAVNPAAADRARLRISSKLLALAKVVQ
jgi:hypothetical protein